jgi:uncharacterized RDD family membrane protein YckC
MNLTDNMPLEPTETIGADLMPRFLARLIDSVILSFVMFALIVPIIFVTIFDTSGSLGLFGGFGLGSIMISIVWAAIVIGYFAFLESSRGQTLGKMIMKLKTVGPDGQNPSLETAVKRNAFYALGIVPVIGGLAQLAAVLYIAYTINDSSTHSGWHDEFAGGTLVMKIT